LIVAAAAAAAAAAAINQQFPCREVIFSKLFYC